MRKPKLSTRLNTVLAASFLLGLAVNLASTLAAGQQTEPKRPNKLVTAKLICVTSMEDNLDQWILDDLRAWGKYRVTGDPEGADLVMRAYKPEKEPRYRVGREGIPQPKGERHELPALSVTVVDWVTNERLWEAEIINKKPKSQDAEPSPGPETQVYARGLKPDQLAQKLTRKLRGYVETLEKAEGSKATPNQKSESRNQKAEIRHDVKVVAVPEACHPERQRRISLWSLFS